MIREGPAPTEIRVIQDWLRQGSERVPIGSSREPALQMPAYQA